MEPNNVKATSSNKTVLIIAVLLIVGLTCCTVSVGAILAYQYFKNRDVVPVDPVVPTVVIPDVSVTPTESNSEKKYDIDFYATIPALEFGEKIDRVIRKGVAVVEFRTIEESGGCKAFAASGAKYAQKQGFDINCLSFFVSDSGIIFEAASPTYFEEIDEGTHIWQYDVSQNTYYVTQISESDGRVGEMITNKTQEFIFFPSIDCMSMSDSCVYKFNTQTRQISSFEYPVYVIPAAQTVFGNISINPSDDKLLVPFNDIINEKQGFNIIDFNGKKLFTQQFDGTELDSYTWENNNTVVVKDQDGVTINRYSISY